MDRTGQTLLGKYELTRMLGKGGMGEVWEGEHTLTGRKVAVKILAQNYLSNRKVVARFGREARAASSVHHAGIVEILDQDKTDDGVPFLVMEFLEGESVGERIRKLGRLSQDEALAIMLPLLDALDAAHQAGIIHRDLKPDNVFILPGPRGEERIKILDFGISQKADEIEHHLTQEGSVLGTPHYMSPEQARGEAGIDARVDVYAAGVLFYECVVGDVPFDAGNYNALLQIILSTPPPAPRSRGADISPAVEQVLLAAMDKKRDRRPPTARVFHDLLLEAGMQEDDALLDTASWTFNTPSEPPPPIDFGPEESSTSSPSLTQVVDEEDSLEADFPISSDASAAKKAADRKPPQKAPAPPPRVPPPPKAKVPAPPARFAEPDALDGDLFANAGRAQSKPAKFESLKPEPMPKPLLVPGRPAPTFDAPGSAAGRANPFDVPPGRGGVEQAPALRGPMIDPAPRFGSVRPMGERPKVSFTTAISKEDSIGRTIMNWVAVVVAIAVLGYLAKTVFTRPDPRKRKRQETEQLQGAGAEQVEGSESAEPK